MTLKLKVQVGNGIYLRFISLHEDIPPKAFSDLLGYFNPKVYSEFDSEILECSIVSRAGTDRKISTVDVSDEEREDSTADASNDDVEEGDAEFEIELHIDPHFDCYCKTGRVCGCGCDPLHDGW